MGNFCATLVDNNHSHYCPAELRRPELLNGEIVTPKLRKFRLEELRKSTGDFEPAAVIGDGGFGTVFKGWVDENTFEPSKAGVGMPVAIKKSNPNSPQGLKEWQAEINFLGKFSHPNLVKLLGHCRAREENQFFLVYEYMQKGSLESHLFRRGVEPLPWEIRLKIAIGAAQGLAFLHTSEKSVIYRDFKASNILLDGSYNAKLSDFGLAKMGPINGKSHVTTECMGTYGYAAPEYISTGHLYIKSDVYGFGIVLLELLTGMRALDTSRPSGQHSLVLLAKPCLSQKKRLKKIMDPRLQNKVPARVGTKVAELILKCIENEPKNRPCMEEVLESLQRISAMKANPSETRPIASHQNLRGRHCSPCQSRHGRSGTTAVASAP